MFQPNVKLGFTKNISKHRSLKLVTWRNFRPRLGALLMKAR
jgi:hypothetical protein